MSKTMPLVSHIVVDFLEALPKSLQYETTATVLLIVFGITCSANQEPIAVLHGELEKMADDCREASCLQIARSIDYFLEGLAAREAKSVQQFQKLDTAGFRSQSKQAFEDAHTSNVLQLEIALSALKSWNKLDFAKAI